MHSTITSLLESYGYIILFLLVGLESLGIPLPGETTLVSAAAFAASGRLSIQWVIATAAVAAIVGDNVGYWIGRKGGIRLIQRYGRILHVDESELERARSFFNRHGAKTVFIGRFIALLRTWVAVLAGVGGMQYGRFMIYNAAGGVTWAVIFGTLGYVFGRDLPKLEHYIGQVSLALALLIALFVALWMGWRWFQRNSNRLAESISQSHFRALPFVQKMREHHPRVWAFLIARFSPDEYLGLHLTIGLIVSLAALWLFAGVTEDVIHHDPLTQFDLTVLEWLHSHNTVLGLRIFQGISWLGSPLFVTALALGTALTLAMRRQWLELVTWAAALAGAGLLDASLKIAIRRPRPSYASAYLSGQSFSFPSGHAMGSLVAYGMFAYLLARFWAKRQSIKIALFVSALVLVLAIGLSRLYLGVHYFSDVIGGYAAGSLWLATCITGLELERARNRLAQRQNL